MTLSQWGTTSSTLLSNSIKWAKVPTRMAQLPIAVTHSCTYFPGSAPFLIFTVLPGIGTYINYMHPNLCLRLLPNPRLLLKEWPFGEDSLIMSCQALTLVSIFNLSDEKTGKQTVLDVRLYVKCQFYGEEKSIWKSLSFVQGHQPRRSSSENTTWDMIKKYGECLN